MLISYQGYPIIMALGFDPIWFAIIMIINMELALISPPVGLNLFVVLLSIFPEIATVLIDNVD